MKTNPVSLLSMGQVVDRMKDRSGAYKLPNGSVLPKFGPAGPRRDSPASGAAGEPSLFDQPTATVKTARFRISDFHLRRGYGGQVGLRIAAAVRDFTRRVAADSWGKISGWTRNVRSRLSNPKSEIRNPQFELALENVTVVRNDLSDADLVVVAAERKTEPVAPAPDVAVPAPTNAWKQVTARWIKMNPEEAPPTATPAMEQARP